jgi:hypothetical protein
MVFHLSIEQVVDSGAGIIPNRFLVLTCAILLLRD